MSLKINVQPDHRHCEATHQLFLMYFLADFAALPE